MRSGDRDVFGGRAFEAFVHGNLNSRLLPVARRYAAFRGLPEVSVREIAVEALERMWRKDWGRLCEATDVVRLRTAYRYMHYVARERHRDYAAQPMLVDPGELRGGSMDARMTDRALARSALETLGKALATLTDEDRALVELSAVAGLSTFEIATEMQMTTTNVTTRLSRARARLKEAVGPELLRELGIGGRRGPRQGGAE